METQGKSEIESLLKQKKLIEAQIDELDQNSISFSVDAAIINRLGKELVGRAETAVSELVKNAYDADATLVNLDFFNSEKDDGTLIIKDDGHGMTRQQLINGFMRLSSPDKVHHPRSPKFNRVRAGRKGIGRFATQRLGTKLIIKTKSEHDINGWELEINWADYKMDQDLSSVRNPIKEVQLDFEHGTELHIIGLREWWTDAQIKRVFRYVSELLQPSFLSDRSKKLNIGREEASFNVTCTSTVDGVTYPIASIDQMIFDHALGIIEGYTVGGKGVCEVSSKRFGVNDLIDVEGDFSTLGDVHFKVHYFIYNFEWYKGYIPKMEYAKIYEFGEENGGIRLFRNGFRVLPYGEKRNDWLNLNKLSVKTKEKAHVPFGSNHFFGFVEVIDRDGSIYEETSSREGLIENNSFLQLSDFLTKSLRMATSRINSARYAEKKKAPKDKNTEDNRPPEKKLEDLRTNDPTTNSIISEIQDLIEEIGMLRVLAAIGLTIGEFTHEIRQFIPSFEGSISFLNDQPDISDKAKESLLNLRNNFDRFRSYTAYIDHSITQNVDREKKPLRLRKVTKDFFEIVKSDMDSSGIELNSDYFGFDLYTCPMHPSEWGSVLYNLYTNSKKALKRSGASPKRIQVVCGEEDNIVYLEFMDNGDGIPKENQGRIFDAFFTTSTPSLVNNSSNEGATGTGLGLKIIRDIIEAYNGEIFLDRPEKGFSTCFRIEIPKPSKEELDQYGY